MSMVRIIPKLEIKGPNLVKGVHLEGLRVLGKPEDFCLEYYKAGADEIFLVDTVASLYGRNNLTDIVRKVASQNFIPLTVGGGVKSPEDFRKLLENGADKVSINTAVIQDPSLITTLANTFGSQAVVVSIQAVQKDGTYECLTDNGRESTGIKVKDWAEQAVAKGAGEIVITSVDRDGTGKGYDKELVKMIADAVPIPVIALGGAGTVQDFSELLDYSFVDGLAAGAIFHYHQIQSIQKRSQEDFKAEGNIDYLNRHGASVRIPKGLEAAPISTLKDHLTQSGYQCRMDFQ